MERERRGGITGPHKGRRHGISKLHLCLTVVIAILVGAIAALIWGAWNFK